METCISLDVLKECILEINGWHQNTPLLLVFSKQKRPETDTVDGGNQAVRATYDSLFSLSHVGISDDARKYYLHFCHGKKGETPFAIRNRSPEF